MAIATLVSWLLTESLGAYMLRAWIASGGLRLRDRRPDGMSLPVLFGHACLAATGLTCWVLFLITDSPIAAWLALGALAPAIGLGISTVTVWTPYPARRPAAAAEPSAASPPASDESLARVLADRELTDRLVDDMVASVLAPDPARGRAGATQQRAKALIPAAHGVLAVGTFLLGTLAAVGAIA